MRQQRSGRIINFSSESGLGNMGQANYGAAKEGIVGFTRTVARDMGRYGVTCNAIRPRAATRLTLTPELMAARAKRAASGIAGAVSTGEPQSFELAPEGIAPFVVWLATDASGNVNGRTFTVYEGYVALLSEPVPMRNIYKDGRWTLDELWEIMPWTVAKGLQPPVAPVPPK